nr:hypothetical protein GCM10020241_02340 [Streptoalloteichus tenebrarius]
MRRWTALAVATGLATFATPAAAALPQHQPPHHCATATQRCDGAIQVPLNWADPNSERISVNFVWVPRADRSRPSAGVVAGLGGGPAGTVRSTSLFVATLGPLLERHDLLVVERRGFGEAAPWRCPEIDLVRQETIRACADRVGPRAQFFTTDQRVADVEAVRGALGVPALMLYGLSYGTLDVQAYLARYPQRVTAAVMDSVVRADANGYVTGTLYSDHLKEGLEQLDVPCRESRSCGSLPGDGASRWAELARHLRREPDPQVPFFALDQLMARLDEPTAGREANAAAAAYLAGDKAPLRRLAPLIGPGRGADMNDMFRTNSAFLAYSCADSAFPYDRSASPEVRRQQLAEYRRTHPERPFTAAEVFGAAGFLEDWCVNWPTPRPSPPLPPDARYPDVPVFAIAGELDGDTAANTTALAREFPRGRSVVVPFGGHTGSVVGYWSYSECLAEQVRSFFVDPTRPWGEVILFREELPRAGAVPLHCRRAAARARRGAGRRGTRERRRGLRDGVRRAVPPQPQLAFHHCPEERVRAPRWHGDLRRPGATDPARRGPLRGGRGGVGGDPTSSRRGRR